MYAIHSTVIYEALTLKGPKKQTNKWKDPIKNPLVFIIRWYPMAVHSKNGEAEAIAAGRQNRGWR